VSDYIIEGRDLTETEWMYEGWCGSNLSQMVHNAGVKQLHHRDRLFRVAEVTWNDDGSYDVAGAV